MISTNKTDSKKTISLLNTSVNLIHAKAITTSYERPSPHRHKVMSAHRMKALTGKQPERICARNPWNFYLWQVKTPSNTQPIPSIPRASWCQEHAHEYQKSKDKIYHRWEFNTSKSSVLNYLTSMTLRRRLVQLQQHCSHLSLPCPLPWSCGDLRSLLPPCVQWAHAQQLSPAYTSTRHLSALLNQYWRNMA